MRAFRKLTGTRKLNIILRRVNELNETNFLSPFFMRVPRLVQLRIEFAGVGNIDEVGYFNLTKGLAKCYCAKAMEFLFFESL